MARYIQYADGSKVQVLRSGEVVEIKSAAKVEEGDNTIPEVEKTETKKEY
tara:strand:- start:467 stop:616 length:150 start_codon:yes stop_codon:yes gene_type:complete